MFLLAITACRTCEGGAQRETEKKERQQHLRSTERGEFWGSHAAVKCKADKIRVVAIEPAHLREEQMCPESQSGYERDFLFP